MSLLRRSNRPSRSRPLAAALILFSFLSGSVSRAENTTDDPIQTRTIRPIVEEFRGRLGIQERVRILFVTGDPKLVSVCRAKNERNVFLLRLDKEFLTGLDEEELRSAIAHEFGHIWIFTHHPYLQTEALANQKALVLVPEESLHKIYLKVTEFRRSAQARAKPHDLRQGLAAQDDTGQPGLAQGGPRPAPRY